MNRFMAIAILICVIMAGCIENQPLSRADLEGAIFTGVIPCADCDGIAYRLSLKRNHRFETSSVYIGKSNRAYTERGQWTMEGDSLIILNGSEPNPRRFKIKNRQLIMLAPDGKEISGSLAKMYVLTESPATMVDTIWQKRRKLGIDFHADGHNPVWSLNVDFDRKLQFYLPGGASIASGVPAIKRDTISGARIWTIGLVSGVLKIEIYPTGCVDDVSGEIFSHFVNIKYGERAFSGCGNFVDDVHKLNDFWVLHEFRGAPVEKQVASSKIPGLQPDLVNKKVYVKTGCRKLIGNLNAKDESLSFGKWKNTSKGCEKSRFASFFFSELKHAHSYKISNGQLILKNGNDTLMIFNRAK